MLVVRLCFAVVEKASKEKAMSIVALPIQLPPVTVPLALIANGMRERQEWAQAMVAGRPDTERCFIIADARVSELLETYAEKLASAATKEEQ
jgi:hypothetical protein